MDSFNLNNSTAILFYIILLDVDSTDVEINFHRTRNFQILDFFQSINNFQEELFLKEIQSLPSTRWPLVARILDWENSRGQKYRGAFRYRKAGEKYRHGGCKEREEGRVRHFVFSLRRESSNNSLCAVKSIDACCRGK